MVYDDPTKQTYPNELAGYIKKIIQYASVDVANQCLERMYFACPAVMERKEQRKSGSATCQDINCPFADNSDPHGCIIESEIFTDLLSDRSVRDERHLGEVLHQLVIYLARWDAASEKTKRRLSRPCGR